MGGFESLPSAFGWSLVIVLGLCVGSFLNVVVHRLPQGESLLRPGSHCPACATPLRARDNVPVCGPTYLHDDNSGKGEKSVTFEVNVPKPGDYRVNFLYVANPNRSTKTPVTVSLGDIEKEIVVNQRESDGIGQSLGTYRIADAVTVTVSNHETDGFVVVDGVQLLPKQ